MNRSSTDRLTALRKKDDSLSKKDKADLLMRKYTLLKQEVHLLLGRYKSHVTHVQIILTAIIAVIGLSLAKDAYFLTSSRMFWILITFSIITIVSYVVFDVIETQYCIIILGARMAILEEMINKLANQNLLTWERKVAGDIYGGSFSPVGDVWHPDYFLSLYLVVLIAASIFLPPVYMAYRFWDSPLEHLLLLRIAVSSAFLYSLVSAFLMVWVGVGVLVRLRGYARAAMREIITGDSN